MYTQFENSHIADKIENIPVDKLKIGDHLIILNGNKDVFVHNYKLKEIKYDKIYNFCNINEKIPSNYNTNEFNYNDANVDHLCAYNNNNSLINLFEYNLHNFHDEELDEIKHIIYEDCKNKVIIDNSHVFKTINKNRRINEAFNYLIIPLNDKEFMCLLKKFIHDENHYIDDYVIFGEYIDPNHKYMKEIKNIEIGNFHFFNSKLRENKCNDIASILKKIKDNLNYDLTQFEEILFAFNYKLRSYLEDLNKDVNIEKVQSTFNKIGLNFNIKNAYEPVFIHESGFKSYCFNRNILITINNQLISWSDLYYEDITIYIRNGLKYILKVPEELKDNKKNQEMFEIAHAIAEFERDGKNGIDPKTGDFYQNGEIKNDRIIYSDTEGLIIKKNQYHEVYINKQGFFIKAKNEEIKEIEERRMIIEKLIE